MQCFRGMFHGLTVFLLLLSGLMGSDHSPGEVSDAAGIYDSLLSSSRSDPPQALAYGFRLMDIPRGGLPDTLYAYTPLQIGYILDKQGFPMQALGFFSIAVSRLEDVGRLHLSGYLHIDIGNIYYRQGEYDKARDMYLKAQQLFIEEDNPDGIYTSINNLGLIKAAMGKSEAALDYFYQALKLARTRRDNPYLLAHSYEYIGGIYRDLGQHDSLRAYQDSTLSVQIRDNRDNLRGLIRRKGAEISLQRGDTAEALRQVRAAEEDFRDPLNIYYLADIYAMEAGLLREMAMGDSLLILLEEAGQFSERYDLRDHRLRFLQQRIELLSQNGDSGALTEAIREYTMLVEEKDESANRIQLERLDILSMLAQYQNRLKLNRLNLRNARNVRNAAMLIGLLLLTQLILLIHRYLNKKRIHREILAQKDLIMQKEQALHREQIEGHEKQLALDRLQREKIERELLWKTTLLQHQNTGFDDFETQFVKVYPGFFDRLSEINPKLTAKDKKICAYHRMNLDTKEIASLCSLSVRTVESARYRLKKKLSIEASINFQEFISTI